MALTKFRNAPINPDRLREEWVAAGLGPLLPSVTIAGFTRLSPRRYEPFTERRVVGVSVVDGTRVEDFADPGELRFALAQPLTPSEDASLDAVLAAHNPAVLSAEQVRQDQDDADAAQLEADFGAWDAMNNAQRFTALKRLVRLVIRRERSAAV